uniref:Histone domain-containing protein n=1 Tax=Steinernema glaseri TaxID=37863 RepID=A0A1I7YK80_9BILA
MSSSNQLRSSIRSRASKLRLSYLPGARSISVSSEEEPFPIRQRPRSARVVVSHRSTRPALHFSEDSDGFHDNSILQQRPEEQLAGQSRPRSRIVPVRYSTESSALGTPRRVIHAKIDVSVRHRPMRLRSDERRRGTSDGQRQSHHKIFVDDSFNDSAPSAHLTLPAAQNKLILDRSDDTSVVLDTSLLSKLSNGESPKKNAKQQREGSDDDEPLHQQTSRRSRVSRHSTRLHKRFSQDSEQMNPEETSRDGPTDAHPGVPQNTLVFYDHEDAIASTKNSSSGGAIPKKYAAKKQARLENIDVSRYLRLVLKKVNAGVKRPKRITPKAMAIMNDLFNGCLHKIATEASSLLKMSNRKTLTDETVKTAIKLVLGGGDLQKYAASKGSEALLRFKMSSS